MKKFSVDLIEEGLAYYFAIDGNNKKEFTLKQKTGILRRSGGQRWDSTSLELNALAEAGKYLEQKINLKTLQEPFADIAFHPGKLIKGNQLLIDYLRQSGNDWRIIFRANLNRRLLFKKGAKEKKSRFDYFSILIKIQLKGQSQLIELGEGGVRGPTFNQDGLISRVKAITQNHKEKRNARLPAKFPVVLSAGDGGILLHEILGHALEADHVYHGQSPFSIDDIGRKITSPQVTILAADKTDPFFKNIVCDDEGEALKSPLLVERGVLKHLLADTFYKKRLNLKHGGHGRTEDFTRLPMPRMYSLYLKPGQYDPGELIESVPLGLYGKEFGEGKIHFDKNMFYFNIRDARLIEKGKLSAPLGNVVVTGNITEVLNSIDMIADDFRFDKGISYCFKKGQTLNVRVGQPTVKINNLSLMRDSDE